MKNQLNRRRRILCHAGLVALCISALSATMLWALPTVSRLPDIRSSTYATTTAVAPGLDGFLHRLITRTERAIDRAGSLFGDAVVVWLWMLLSATLALLVAAVASVADIRMVQLRRQGLRALPRYVGHGTRMFFRLVRDRRTPNLARSVLVLGLLYWLLPDDLIPDATFLPGFADDLVIAAVAGKAFMYLCPDALIQRHAEAIEADARA